MPRVRSRRRRHVQSTSRSPGPFSSPRERSSVAASWAGSEGRSKSESWPSVGPNEKHRGRQEMSFSIEFEDDCASYNAKIKVVGVGGSGNNAINTMIHFG